PDRAVLVRPATPAHAQIRGFGRERRATRRGPVQGRDLSGQRRERLRGGRGLGAAASAVSYWLGETTFLYSKTFRTNRPRSFEKIGAPIGPRTTSDSKALPTCMSYQLSPLKNSRKECFPTPA